MSELNIGPPPSSTPTRAIVAAVVILILIAAGFFYYFSFQKAELSITRVQLYAAHTETPLMQGGSNIIGVAPHADNDLYVVLTVKLTNKLHLPLFIKDETAILTAPDHSIADTSAIEQRDLANLFTTFPALQTLASALLARDTQIAPGQSAEGTVILHFTGAREEDWNKRESATLNLDFFHGLPLTVKIP